MGFAMAFCMNHPVAAFWAFLGTGPAAVAVEAGFGTVDRAIEDGKVPREDRVEDDEEVAEELLVERADVLEVARIEVADKAHFVDPEDELECEEKDNGEGCGAEESGERAEGGPRHDEDGAVGSSEKVVAGHHGDELVDEGAAVL